MSDVLTDRLEELAAVFTGAQLNAFTVVPEIFVAPMVFVAPADPYITPGQQFGGDTLRHEVGLVAGLGVNEVVVAELNGLIVQVLGLLYALDPTFVVEEVGRPGQITLGGQKYTATVITVNSEIRL